MAKSMLRSQKRNAAFLKSKDGPLTRSQSQVKSPAPVIRRRGESLQSVYTLGTELGSGSFAVTYKCKNRVTGKKFACKSIPKHKQGMTQKQCDYVRREVEIMQRLAAHENIVQLREVYEDSDFIHLVMERCFGGELNDRIVEKKYYDEREAACLCKKIVEGVQTCHSAGVMHRDMKLENILFVTKDEDSPIKFIDFGLSIQFKKDEVFEAIVGSRLYTAPEVYTQRYSKEADIWSVGVILYILLCGKYPFRSYEVENSPDSIAAQFDFSPWDKISGAAKHLVKNILEHDPARRLTADAILRHPWIRVKSKPPELIRDESKINLGPPQEHGNTLGDRLLEENL